MIAQQNLSSRAWSELILLGLIWGVSFLAVAIALDEIAPLTSVAHRTFWAMLILWICVAMMRQPIPRDPQIWVCFFVMGLLNNVVPFSLMAWGQLHIDSGLTAILNAATAVFSVVTAALFFADERMTLRKTAGVLLGFLGVATTIGPGALMSFDPTSLAQIAVLGGTVSYALASVWARKTLTGLSPHVAAAGMLTGAAAVAIPLAWIVDGPISLALQPATIAAIGYYAIVATAGAYLLYYRVLAMAGAGNLMLVTLIVPPVAILLGAWIRDESLSLRAFSGFFLLVLGLLILDGRLFRRGNRRSPDHI